MRVTFNSISCYLFRFSFSLVFNCSVLRLLPTFHSSPYYPFPLLFLPEVTKHFFYTIKSLLDNLESLTITWKSKLDFQVFKSAITWPNIVLFHPFSKLSHCLNWQSHYSVLVLCLFLNLRLNLSNEFIFPESMNHIAQLKSTTWLSKNKNCYKLLVCNLSNTQIFPCSLNTVIFLFCLIRENKQTIPFTTKGKSKKLLHP